MANGCIGDHDKPSCWRVTVKASPSLIPARIPYTSLDISLCLFFLWQKGSLPMGHRDMPQPGGWQHVTWHQSHSYFQGILYDERERGVAKERKVHFLVAQKVRFSTPFRERSAHTIPLGVGFLHFIIHEECKKLTKISLMNRWYIQKEGTVQEWHCGQSVFQRKHVHLRCTVCLLSIFVKSQYTSDLPQSGIHHCLLCRRPGILPLD
jgi:hypothetical protein